MTPETVALPETDLARRAELAEQLDEFAAEYPYGVEDAPEDIQAEVQSVQAELDAFEDRERAFRPEDMARAGAMVMLAGDGTLTVERGFVRPEDEPQPEPAIEDPVEAATHVQDEAGDEDGIAGEVPDGNGLVASAVTPGPAPKDKAPALPADLDAELSAHRTAALRAEIMRQPDLALRVLVHGLATTAFYGPYMATVARVGYAHGMAHGVGGVGADSPARQAITAAEDEQRAKLPNDQAAL